MLAVGVFAVLVLVRLACLKIHLKDSSESQSKKRTTSETPMKVHTVKSIAFSIGETAWTLGGNVVGGLFLS
jgi:hypothetical protein